MQTRTCEFFVHELCSLTGRGCFCELGAQLTCTRREFAHSWEVKNAKHITPAGRVARVVTDDPESGLPIG